MISQVILEYTGLSRNRKQVSSHIQRLGKISARVPEVSSRLTQQFSQQLVRAAAKLSEANREDTAKIDQILRQTQQVTFLLARRNRQIELAPTQRRRRQRSGDAQAPPKPQIRSEKVLPDGPSDSLFHEISRFSPQNDRELSLQLLRPLASTFLALSSVNRFSRTDVLQYIESQLSFDFTWDANDLKAFCTHIKPICRRHVRHIAIEFVESHAPDLLTSSTTLGAYLSDNLPNLQKLFLTLIPRDPVWVPQHLVLTDVSQWTQSEQFLSSLGDLKATVVLSLRSMDCEYFESKFVGVRGWRYIGSGNVPELELTLPTWSVLDKSRAQRCGLLVWKTDSLTFPGRGCRWISRGCRRISRTCVRGSMSWLRDPVKKTKDRDVEGFGALGECGF